MAVRTASKRPFWCLSEWHGCEVVTGKTHCQRSNVVVGLNLLALMLEHAAARC